MPSKSKAQQRLFGMAYAAKKNDTPKKDMSPEIRKIVENMSKKQIRDFAKTKTSDLPENVRVVESKGDSEYKLKNKTTILNLKQYNTKVSNYMNNQEFLEYLRNQKEIVKQAFIAADILSKQAGAGGAMPVAGAPAPVPAPDPSMGMPGGGAMPPIDPNTGMPIDPNTGMPMNPNAMAAGGAMPQGVSPSPDEVVDMLDSMSQAMSQFENDINSAKQEVQELRVQVASMQGQMETILNILNKGSAGAPKPVAIQ